MSRSNPQESAPNPAVRWFEWNGEKGLVRYYDKEVKKNVELGNDFTFLLLDQLASVGGWHDASDSGIYSNQVKDTRKDPLVVKSFKGGILAEGLYKAIKDRVNAAGGSFVANLYIAFKEDGELAIGVLRVKGAALRAWMEFTGQHRGRLYEDAIRINGSDEGKKGSVTFHTPKLFAAPVGADTQKQAVALDAKFQEWLASYLKRTTTEQVEHPAAEPEQTETPARATTVDDDPIPF